MYQFRIDTNVGSDNRVYFTAIESYKGRNTNPNAPMNKVLAPVDGSVVRASSICKQLLQFIERVKILISALN